MANDSKIFRIPLKINTYKYINRNFVGKSWTIKQKIFFLVHTDSRYLPAVPTLMSVLSPVDLLETVRV